VRSPLPAVAEGIRLLYAAHQVVDEREFADFHVRIARPSGMRRWLHPQVVFQYDGAPPFHPLPGDQGFPIMEWGLNWCITAHCHQYLILHAAVLERNGAALILPAPPGSGKSTLCAGLAHRGWRLLSDELALVELAGLNITPLARPISLKNASIDVIRSFAPEAVFSPTVHDTLKGSVAHVKPAAASVRLQEQQAAPRWVVMPRYAAGVPARLEALPKGRAFMQLVESAFNYDLHGSRGFGALTRVIERCATYEFRYAQLDEAVEVFDRLAGTA
jgi:HprK-related kinase A